MILQWILIAYLLKCAFDRIPRRLRSMTLEEYMKERQKWLR